MMFKPPEITSENSVKMIVHTIKVKNEYVPTLELIFPSEESLNIETLLAMREALEFSYRKIDKILEKI